MNHMATTAFAPEATPTKTSLPDLPALTLLTFMVSGQQYGLPVTDVIRIIEMVTITHLPTAPDIIQGIINLHGKAVPVMDLRQRFNLPAPTYGLHTPIILADIGRGRVLGLIVDTVETVLDVPSKELELVDVIVPAELAAQLATQATYLAGVAKVDRQMILILNVQALLLPAERARLSQALDVDHNRGKTDR